MLVQYYEKFSVTVLKEVKLVNTPLALNFFIKTRTKVLYSVEITLSSRENIILMKTKQYIKEKLHIFSMIKVCIYTQCEQIAP